MNGYEQIVQLMKHSAEQRQILALCSMTSNTSCIFNELKLEADDLYISEHLKTGYYTNVNEEMAFIEPLKSGDLVIVVKVNNEKYAILERVV